LLEEAAEQVAWFHLARGAEPRELLVVMRGFLRAHGAHLISKEEGVSEIELPILVLWASQRITPRIGQSRRDPFNKGDLDGSVLSAQRDRFLM
jgi:hypothetical protein